MLNRTKSFLNFQLNEKFTRKEKKSFKYQKNVLKLFKLKNKQNNIKKIQRKRNFLIVFSLFSEIIFEKSKKNKIQKNCERKKKKTNQIRTD